MRKEYKVIHRIYKLLMALRKVNCPKKLLTKAWEEFWDKDKQVYTGTELILTEPKSSQCILCNHLVYMTDDGFPTCSHCGHFEKDILDFSPEWNSFKDEKNGRDMTRCCNPENPLLKESSGACKVLKNAKCSFEMRKIDKWIEWQSMPHKEKTLYDEFQYITNMGRIAGVSMAIIDTALIKHKEISDEQMFRGVNRDGIKAASIYLAFRINGFPRTASEIAKMFLLDKKQATKGCAIAVNILNNIERNSLHQTELCKITTLSIIERYCCPFEPFNEELILFAKFVAYKIEKDRLITDNTPQAIASGIIQFINCTCQCNIPKNEILQKCEISDVTLNKCYKKICKLREHVLPKDIVVKYKISA